MKSKLIIGISGDSGVGKSSLLNTIKNIYDKNCTILNGDNYHKWERNNENWKIFTHLNIEANRLEDGYSDLLSLKNGKEKIIKVYDHTTGKFSKLRKLEPKEIIIYEGLHSFYPEKINSLYDLKIFIKADEPLRRHWKIIRDIEKRGYTKEKVLKQLEIRSSDSLNYINTQEKYADLIIHHQLLTNISSFTQLLGDASFKVNYETKIICVNPKYYDLIVKGGEVEQQIKQCLIRAKSNK